MTPHPARATPLIWLRSWLYLFLFLGWTVIASISFLPLLISQRSALVAVRLWVNGIMLLARTVAGITSRVEDLENVPQGPVIIAAQHQASFETYRMFTVLEHPVFILKHELTWIPLLGWYMHRAGFIYIDRAAGAGAMRKMMRETKAALDAGRQVIVFPEGTRSQDGRVARFKGGSFLVALQAGLPVVPISVVGSRHVMLKGRLATYPGKVTLIVHPPIDTTGMADDEPKAFGERVRQVVQPAAERDVA